MIQEYRNLAKENSICTIVDNDRRVEDAVAEIYGMIFGDNHNDAKKFETDLYI